MAVVLSLIMCSGHVDRQQRVRSLPFVLRCDTTAPPVRSIAAAAAHPRGRVSKALLAAGSVSGPHAPLTAAPHATLAGNHLPCRRTPAGGSLPPRPRLSVLSQQRTATAATASSVVLFGPGWLLSGSPLARPGYCPVPRPRPLPTVRCRLPPDCMFSRSSPPDSSASVDLSSPAAATTTTDSRLPVAVWHPVAAAAVRVQLRSSVWRGGAGGPVSSVC